MSKVEAFQQRVAVATRILQADATLAMRYRLGEDVAFHHGPQESNDVRHYHAVFDGTVQRLVVLRQYGAQYDYVPVSHAEVCEIQDLFVGDPYEFQFRAFHGWTQTNDLPDWAAPSLAHHQDLAARVAEIALAGGLGPQEFARPGGWLERAQRVLQGNAVEPSLVSELRELSDQHTKLRDHQRDMSAALDEVVNSLDANDVGRAREASDILAKITRARAKLNKMQSV